MRYSGTVCAMCGDELTEAYGRYRLPPLCVKLMDGGNAVDPSSIADSVSIDLCKACAGVARRMIREYDTSPLPEFDVDAASWLDAVDACALRDDDLSADQIGSDGIDRRVVVDAAMTVKAHQDGAAERITEGKIDRAYVVFMAVDELATLESDVSKLV